MFGTLHRALEIAGLRYRVVVKLALCREEHDFSPIGAEPAVLQVGATEHVVPFLAALREV